MKKRMICFMIALVMVFSLGSTGETKAARAVNPDMCGYHTISGKGFGNPWIKVSNSVFKLSLGKKNSDYLDRIRIRSKKFGTNIVCSVKSAGSDWKSVKSGEQIGKTGKRIEAVSFKLTEKDANNWDIWYRVKTGTSNESDGWKINGEKTDIVSGKYVRHIQIMIKHKSVSASYSTRVGGSWDATKIEYASGNTKDPINAVGLKLVNKKTDWFDYSDSSIYYSVLSGGRWSAEKKDGQTCSQRGNYGISAIKIRLSGSIDNVYSVYYRVHVKDLGWMAWTKNNGKAGDYNGKITAIQVKFVKGGASSPGIWYRGVNSNFSRYATNTNILAACIGTNGEIKQRGIVPETKEPVRQSVSPSPTKTHTTASPTKKPNKTPAKPTSTPKPTTTPSEEPTSCADGKHVWSDPYEVENAYVSYEYKDIGGCKICGSPLKGVGSASSFCTHSGAGWWQYKYREDTNHSAKTEHFCIKCGATEVVSESVAMSADANGCNHIIIYEPAFKDKSKGNIYTWTPCLKVADDGKSLLFGCYQRCVKCKKLIDKNGNVMEKEDANQVVPVLFNGKYYGTYTGSGNYEYDLITSGEEQDYSLWPGFFSQSPDFGTRFIRADIYRGGK